MFDLIQAKAYFAENTIGSHRGIMQELEKLLGIMKRLRKECPWDAKQDHKSLKRYLIEECYEVIETIDAQDYNKMKGELGDVLLQLVFHSAIAEENQAFTFRDIITAISDKMIERHPHIYGDKSVHSASEVQDNWEKIKHKNESRQSIVEGIPSALPSLIKAQRMQEKAASVGFDWERSDEIIDKLAEEIAEFREASAQKSQANIEAEFGDILFTLVNLARKLNISADNALEVTNKKFIQRFQYIEKMLDYDQAKLESSSLEILDKLWNEAKNEKHEHPSKI